MGIKPKSSSFFQTDVLPILVLLFFPSASVKLNKNNGQADRVKQDRGWLTDLHSTGTDRNPIYRTNNRLSSDKIYAE